MEIKALAKCFPFAKSKKERFDLLSALWLMHRQRRLISNGNNVQCLYMLQCRSNTSKSSLGGIQGTILSKGIKYVFVTRDSPTSSNMGKVIDDLLYCYM